MSYFQFYFFQSCLDCKCKNQPSLGSLKEAKERTFLSFPLEDMTDHDYYFLILNFKKFEYYVEIYVLSGILKSKL